MANLQIQRQAIRAAYLAQNGGDAAALPPQIFAGLLVYINGATGATPNHRLQVRSVLPLLLLRLVPIAIAVGCCRCYTELAVPPLPWRALTPTARPPTRLHARTHAHARTRTHAMALAMHTGAAGAGRCACARLARPEYHARDRQQPELAQGREAVGARPALPAPRGHVRVGGAVRSGRPPPAGAQLQTGDSRQQERRARFPAVPPR
jgi:hypothetical protein